MVGTTISHYKVLEELGAGGMGIVYRAHDTKLNRDVALKILPEQFASDSQRMGRFQREAEVLASLDHPNIGQIYGIEEAGQTKALVLQLIEGPTLAERIAQGPIPVEDALKIALQIAEGLEAAHEKGVIHRDLKPANIKITPEGQVKILDFGLAKALEGETPPDTNLSQSPTLTAAATQAGVILGTAAYMSPEQARGKPVDKRTDIWAFGAVLYEMLTGNNSFEGEDISLTLAAVMKEDPDWEALPNNRPAPIDRVLRRCLDKDSRHRLQHIGDARIPIQDYLADPSAYEVAETVPLQPSDKRKMLPWLLAAVVASVIITLIAVLAFWSPRSEPTAMRRWTVNLGPTESIPDQDFSAHAALSPNGTRLVYAAPVDGTRQLYVRPLDQLEAQPIPGTNGAVHPFFSPDGEWVGFFTTGDYKLKKVLVRGGPPQTLCDANAVRQGGSWGADDTIFFSNGSPVGLFSVPASGGIPRALTTRNPEQGERLHLLPEILPGGHSVLFQIVPPGGPADDSNIAVLSLQTGEYRTLIEGGHNARYAPTGHVVFGRAGALWAVPFDLNRLEKTGPEAPILEGIQVNRFGVAPYSFSDDGLLVYLPGGNVGATRRSLLWVYREGNEESLFAEPRAYINPRLSPDGSRLAVTVDDSGNRDIWIYDLGRQTPTRLTFDPTTEANPVWTPDGQRVVFGSNRRGQFNLYWKAADGIGQVERLTTSPNYQSPSSFSPDGKSLVFYEQKEPYEIGVLSMEGERTSKPLLQTEFDEMRPAISPDGRWIAYMSNERGGREIYVRPFPNVQDAQWQISSDGGVSPVWAPNGGELFYRNGEAMMVVKIETEPSLRHGRPQVLFTGSYAFATRNYDISPDGQRFLMIKEGEQTADTSEPTQLIVVENWFEELKRLVPTDN